LVSIAGPRSILRLGNVRIQGKEYPVEISHEAYEFLKDMWRRTGGDVDDVQAGAAAADTAQTAADSAQASADAADTSATAAQSSADAASINVVPQAFQWNTDTLGAWPVGGLTQDLVIAFTSSTGTIATRTVRGVLNNTTGNITLSSVSSTGEATTVAFQGSGTMVGIVTVTHTNSSRTGTATYTALDLSIAGGINIVGFF